MVSHEISEVATVISRPVITAIEIIKQLHKMGVQNLMIEGGSKVLSMFLAERCWDELRLAVAPVFVGDSRAPRLVLDGEYPPMALVKTERLGQTAVMHFVNRSQSRADSHLLERALAVSLSSEPSEERYRVGAVVVTREGQEFEGYTAETAPDNHAEEEAIAKALAEGADLRGATMYCTMEPCTTRSSKPTSCTELIIRNGFSRVVFALREPDLFVRCEGTRRLEEAGIEVLDMDGYATDVLRINSHVLS
jgi:pyrimidine deaminase RibD-like protein